MIPVGSFQLRIFCGSLFKLKIVPELHPLWSAEGMTYKINAKILLQIVWVCSVCEPAASKELLKIGWTWTASAEGVQFCPKMCGTWVRVTEISWWAKISKIFWSKQETFCPDFQDRVWCSSRLFFVRFKLCIYAVLIKNRVILWCCTTVSLKYSKVWMLEK